MIQLLVKNILTSEKVDSSVDVIFVNDKFMRQLNKKFTKRDRTTDVLSFGMRGGEPEAIEYSSLGDIYVSLDRAKTQAVEYKAGLEEEVARLVAHGLLHLLGYDHKGKNQKSIMRKKEEEYLKNVRELLESG